MSGQAAYHEELLHWVWETARMDTQRLCSSDGKPITIYDPGRANRADGPDFLEAHIKIGRLTWSGDIELHWRTADWNNHNHHHDTNYNRVILHVVWEDNKAGGSSGLREDGTAPAKLCLKDYVSKPLQSFLEQFQKPETLPCSGHISFISREAFEQQLEAAGREYFEQKVDDLLCFWDPSLPPSKAWVKMLAIGLFDGLGVAYNRRPMRELCKKIYPHLEELARKQHLLELSASIFKKQAADESSKNASQWVFKGSRPANQPAARIAQAVCALWYLHKLPFKTWISEDPNTLWEQLQKCITVQPGLGKQRSDILFGTVWLPAFFILGTVFMKSNLKESSLSAWRQHRVSLPPSLTKPLHNLSIPGSVYRHQLGTIHQLRAYCKPRHCRHCKVFKSVISS